MLIFVAYLLLAVLDPMDLVIWITERADSIRGNIGWVATILSLVAYGKLRFLDTRTIKKLQQVHGKEKFLQALQVILQMLDAMSIDTLVSKVLSINDIDVEMRRALVKIRDIFDSKDLREDEPPHHKVKIPRDVKRGIREEINKILKMIDKKIELEIMASESRSITEVKGMFVDAVEKMRWRKPRYDAADKMLKERGREKLTRNT